MSLVTEMETKGHSSIRQNRRHVLTAILIQYCRHSWSVFCWQWGNSPTIFTQVPINVVDNLQVERLICRVVRVQDILEMNKQGLQFHFS